MGHASGLSFAAPAEEDHWREDMDLRMHGLDAKLEAILKAVQSQAKPPEPQYVSRVRM